VRPPATQFVNSKEIWVSLSCDFGHWSFRHERRRSLSRETR